MITDFDEFFFAGRAPFIAGLWATVATGEDDGFLLCTWKMKSSLEASRASADASVLTALKITVKDREQSGGDDSREWWCTVHCRVDPFVLGYVNHSIGHGPNGRVGMYKESKLHIRFDWFYA